MKYKLISLLVAVGFSLCAFSAENDVTAMISNAEKFYAAKEYDKAIEEYSQVMDHNVVSSDILYNLGNCYYHNDDWGNAVVSYLEAQKLDPSNDKINGNLTFLLSKVEDKNAAGAADKSVRVAVDEKGFFESLYTALVKSRFRCLGCHRHYYFHSDNCRRCVVYLLAKCIGKEDWFLWWNCVLDSFDSGQCVRIYGQIRFLYQG